MKASSTFGEQLRGWRLLRRMSQLDLALEAGISSRHLSFVETGRASPSRAMVRLLAEKLAIPPRRQNELLLAAGYAPAFIERDREDPALKSVMASIATLLQAHEPFPALCVDQRWNMLLANRALEPLVEGAAAWLLEPPVNVLRLSLHPEGVASRILNLAEWKRHILHRLQQQFASTGDAKLDELAVELATYPAGPDLSQVEAAVVATPLRIVAGDRVLSFISTTLHFTTALEVGLSELAIETFLPADEDTRSAVQGFIPD